MSNFLAFDEWKKLLSENDNKDQIMKMSSQNERSFAKLFNDNKIPYVNLNNVARDITMVEGGKENLDIGEIKGLLAVIGDRWRKLPFENIMAEIYAIIDRAG